MRVIKLNKVNFIFIQIALIRIRKIVILFFIIMKNVSFVKKLD